MQYVYAVQLILMLVMPLVKMVMRAVGIGFVTYVGANLVIGQAKDYVVSHAGAMGDIVQQILGLAKIDVAINIYFAAVTTRMVLAGLDKLADRKRKQVWHEPGRDYIDA